MSDIFTYTPVKKKRSSDPGDPGLKSFILRFTLDVPPNRTAELIKKIRKTFPLIKHIARM